MLLSDRGFYRQLHSIADRTYVLYQIHLVFWFSLTWAQLKILCNDSMCFSQTPKPITAQNCNNEYLLVLLCCYK